MRISSIYIQNFRKLVCCQIDFSKDTTLFVGANNSGKTSAMDALGKFLAGRDFFFNDLTISNRTEINAIGNEWIAEDCEVPEDVVRWDIVLPKMDIWLDVESNEIHYVANIIPTLKWRKGILGVRLMYQPKDVSKLFADYKEAYFAARTTEAAKPKPDTAITLFPKNLCDFLEKKLSTYFSIKSYILDPAKSQDALPQTTPFGMECLTDNPLKGIVRIDLIPAHRGFADPDTHDGAERARQQLSAQMRSYYDKHLDPEKTPTPDDLEILSATEKAKSIFDDNLSTKFEPKIKELENLGYPGMADPKITISTKVSTGETLRHESAVQYALSKSDKDMKLPERYNGLGYQNLISMVFDLIGFRDGWMRDGKAMGEDVIEPLHLVLIEEPEAHLHMQVQQVFIREAFTVLRNHDNLKTNDQFATQLVISTHSSHIAREVNFANLRYFKRLAESEKYSVSTAEVINLCDVFGKEDATDKFVTRYLQSTHCDLFFADAAIFVEGAAENMLVPHFIRNRYKELNQRYISMLSIGGRHSHRLSPLINKLCLPTLIITDLDSVDPNDGNRKVRPERNKKFVTTNYALTKWLVKENCLDKLYDLAEANKIFTYTDPYEHQIRIAYQTPISLDYQGSEVEALPRTFEDSIIYTNLEMLGTVSDDENGLIKKIKAEIASKKPFDDLHKSIYDLLRDGSSSQKAEFALDLIYAIDPADLTIPAYIAEGLEWLQNLLHREEL